MQEKKIGSVHGGKKKGGRMERQREGKMEKMGREGTVWWSKGKWMKQSQSCAL